MTTRCVSLMLVTRPRRSRQWKRLELKQKATQSFATTAGNSPSTPKVNSGRVFCAGMGRACLGNERQVLAP